MRSAFECFQEAAKCEQKAKHALTEEDRDFLLDAARFWKALGEDAAKAEAAQPLANA